jgi:predicted dehydrogenase
MKVLLVGAGRIGKRHAEQIVNLCELIAVCDTNEHAASALANQYNVPFFTSIESMLDEKFEAEIVSICTPNGLHAQHSILCFIAGYHVLCEKPMALSSVECISMMESASKNKKRLFVVKQNRYNEPVKVLNQLIQNNTLGKIYSIHLACCWNRNSDYYQTTWHGTKQMDGGILFTQFSHFIDLIVWLFGDVQKVQSFAHNISNRKDIEFEDSVVTSCLFENGAMGTFNFSINAHTKNMEGAITVVAEKGTIKIGGEYLNKLEYVEGKFKNITIEDSEKEANDYGDYKGSMSNHDIVYRNIKKALKGELNNFPNGKDGLRAVRLIERIYESSKMHTY